MNKCINFCYKHPAKVDVHNKIQHNEIRLS